MFLHLLCLLACLLACLLVRAPPLIASCLPSCTYERWMGLWIENGVLLRKGLINYLGGNASSKALTCLGPDSDDFAFMTNEFKVGQLTGFEEAVDHEKHISLKKTRKVCHSSSSPSRQ
ncbi:hypothetical protein B0H65DRAFT_439699 [Neurospora tetraspora]|uniref:Uncharacterized protein n=1 Tax=Neurospora tetraspora TaxID=94610 RepID=A0AAE0JJA0_9PEZI|nr:hypothetical protein B0H65DRAFT_439699 [Neurospora tetraspora]